MGDLAESVLLSGGKVIGVEPQFFIDAGFEYNDITELIVTHDMSERKAKMIELGNAFITFPGGSGTLEEISEVISKVMLGHMSEPVMIYNLDGYYNDLKNLFVHMIEKGLCDKKIFEKIRFVENLEEIKKLLNDSEAAELHEYIEEVNAIDIAVISEDLDDRELWRLCQLLQDDDLAKVLEQASDIQRTRIAENITNDELIEVFGYMQKDDIADLIGDMKYVQKKALLNQMMEDDRKIIRTLLNYPEDSAGGIMTTAYIALDEKLTVEQGMRRIRQIANKSEVIETIYIVDHSQSLVGVANLRDFLTAKKDDLLKDIMKVNPIYVHPEDDQEYAAKLVSKYDLNAIPVVNNRGSILGI